MALVAGFLVATNVFLGIGNLLAGGVSPWVVAFNFSAAAFIAVSAVAD